LRNTAERRLELLKLEGQGFSKTEIVTEISAKYQVSTRTVYKDFTSRESWQPYTTKEAALTILNRYEQIYRDASLNSLTAESESNRIGWKKLMLDANTKLAEHFVIPSILNQLKDLEKRAEHGVFL
jgi:transcriptional antiterminator